MKRASLAATCLFAHLRIYAQKAKAKPELFEGVWQVIAQSNGDVNAKRLPPRTNDFKIYGGLEISGTSFT